MMRRIRRSFETGTCHRIEPTRASSANLSRTLLALKHFTADQRGATAIEYSMIAVGVAMAIIATVMSLGSTLKTTFYDRLLSMM
jgi:pilus assembly protein Flp/PilA